MLISPKQISISSAFGVWESGEDFVSPTQQIIALPRKTSLQKPSYPEGNFGGNQQLNNSISLSPLYQTETSDLHVNTVTGFHRNFFRLHHRLAKIIIFRVSPNVLYLRWIVQTFHPTEVLHADSIDAVPSSTPPIGAFTFIPCSWIYLHKFGFSPQHLHIW